MYRTRPPAERTINDIHVGGPAGGPAGAAVASSIAARASSVPCESGEMKVAERGDLS